MTDESYNTVKSGGVAKDFNLTNLKGQTYYPDRLLVIIQAGGGGGSGNNKGFNFGAGGGGSGA